MLRFAVLAALLTGAAWSAREAGWFSRFFPLTPAGSPHERYERALEGAGLADTTLGRNWIRAADDALDTPASVQLPSTQQLAIDATTARAWAYEVHLKRGQRVEVATTVVADMPTHAFVDVFTTTGAETTSDSRFAHERGSLQALTYEATRDREIVVRIQPELLGSGTLELTLRASPALRFPVANARTRDLQSVFGDPRDAGRRQHEGVDIFAKRGTPVLSATDGLVMRVGETGLGGRVVWVWDLSRGLRLYYAHLDEQLVSTGERVRAGQVLGTVGNTGNARTTAPHLHFGIYERGIGAIDPYWFIAPARMNISKASR